MRGILAEKLSAATQQNLRALQQYANEAAEMFRELSDRGIALLRVTEDAARRNFLQHGPANDAQKTLERFARFRDLHSHLQSFAKKANERTGDYLIARPGSAG